MENMILLINELRKLDNETPWVEFKHNNYDPVMIGNDICALANAATLHEKPQAYMLWGIDNESHDIVGTDYNLQNLKKGNKELLSVMQQEAKASFEERRNTARKLGEEAETKLLLPMIVMLAITMLIIIIPAYYSFAA